MRSPRSHHPTLAVWSNRTRWRISPFSGPTRGGRTQGQPRPQRWRDRLAIATDPSRGSKRGQVWAFKTTRRPGTGGTRSIAGPPPEAPADPCTREGPAPGVRAGSAFANGPLLKLAAQPPTEPRGRGPVFLDDSVSKDQYQVLEKDISGLECCNRL